MSLALVIPVHNDQANLDRLLAQAAGFGIFDEVVVVDDGSDLPVVLPSERPEAVTLLRIEKARGAGAARNLGLEHITASHMIFFDADDLFTAEFVQLWGELSGLEYDFCIYRHHDDSARYFGGASQLPHDMMHWSLAGAATQRLSQVDSAALWRLAMTGNYPWNKIYRTGFVKDNGLRCTETLVHNDIELHWRGFLAANTVLASNRICAEHFVHQAKQRLTHETGAKRLQLFEPLDIVSGLVQSQADPAAELAFLQFCDGILRWVRQILPQALWPDLDRYTEAFLKAAFREETLLSVTAEDPALALRLTLLLAHCQSSRHEAAA